MFWLLFAVYPACSPGWYSQQATLRTEVTPPPGKEHVHFESHRFPKLTFSDITQIHTHSVHLNPTPPCHVAPGNLGQRKSDLNLKLSLHAMAYIVESLFLTGPDSASAIRQHPWMKLWQAKLFSLSIGGNPTPFTVPVKMLSKCMLPEWTYQLQKMHNIRVHEIA